MRKECVGVSGMSISVCERAQKHGTFLTNHKIFAMDNENEVALHLLVQ